MRRVVQLAGRDVELTADDERRWEAIEALFAACPASSNAPQFRLRFDRTAPGLPDRPADLSYTGIEVWLGGDGAACRSASGVAARRHGDEIHVGGPSDDGRTPDGAGGSAIDLGSAFRRSVQHVMADALAEHGRHTLHAAALRQGDQVVVALGGTGAGKSTLAYAGSRRGWSVLSDDLTFLAVDAGAVLAWGLPKPLNIPADLLDDDHRGSVIADDERRRVRVPLEHSLAAGTGHVSAVLLVEHSAGDGYVEPFESGPPLLKTLLPSFPLAPDRLRLRALFPVAAALSRLPAWTLHHDADPARRVDVAGTLIDQVADANQ